MWVSEVMQHWKLAVWGLRKSSSLRLSLQASPHSIVDGSVSISDVQSKAKTQVNCLELADLT